MNKKTQDIQFSQDDNIQLEAEVQQGFDVFQDFDQGPKIAQYFNISGDSNLNLNISSENDQFSGRNLFFELRQMPFKKQIKLFLSYLRKSIPKNNIVPEHFLPIFAKKANEILLGLRSGRNQDISHFVQFWILIQNLAKQIRDFKKKIILFIQKIKSKFSRSHTGNNNKIRQISERILECILNFQIHKNLNKFIADLWGPIIKSKDFQKLVSKIPRMKKSLKNWISSNMNIICTIDYETYE